MLEAERWSWRASAGAPRHCAERPEDEGDGEVEEARVREVSHPIETDGLEDGGGEGEGGVHEVP